MPWSGVYIISLRALVAFCSWLSPAKAVAQKVRNRRMRMSLFTLSSFLPAKPGERHLLPHHNPDGQVEAHFLYPRGGSRLSSLRLTRSAKIAHPSNEGQPKRKARRKLTHLQREEGLGRKPEVWASCLEAGSFWGIDALGRPVLPFGRVEYLDLKLAWLNSGAREPRW
jgi:hypothetical protein